MIFPGLQFDSKIIEKRRLKEFPSFSFHNVHNFTEDFETYFNDHFGFRNYFVRLNNLLKLRLFNVSGMKKVIVGKEGWLFYTGNSVVDDYRGVNQLSNSDLEKWRQVLQAKKDWLASKGIAYLFVVAPNKHSIYPEYLPDGILRVNRTSPADQIVTYLKGKSDVDFLDLRGVLRSRKKDGLLYFPTDTHWTSLGAFYGYEEIIKRVSSISPVVESLKLDAMVRNNIKREGLGLATLLGIQDIFTENVTNLVVKNRKSFQKKKGDRLLVRGTRNKQLPKAVMFRDSFAMALIPFLSENFSDIHYITKKWHKKTLIKKIINDTKPDIVIEEWCERYLKSMGAVSIKF